MTQPEDCFWIFPMLYKPLQKWKCSQLCLVCVSYSPSIFVYFPLLASICGHSILDFSFGTVSRPLFFGYNHRLLSFDYSIRPLSYHISQKYWTCPSLQTLFFFPNPIPPPLPCNISKLLFPFQNQLVKKITNLTGLMKLSPTAFTSSSDITHFSNYISCFYDNMILLPLIILIRPSFTHWWWPIVDSGVHRESK